MGVLDYRQQLSLSPGVTEYVFSLDGADLADGAYMLSVDLTIPNKSIIDRVDNCLSFEIVRKSPSHFTRFVNQQWGYGSFPNRNRLCFVYKSMPLIAQSRRRPMNLIEKFRRRLANRLHRSKNSFRYCGVTVYHPRDCLLLSMFTADGRYEADNIRLIQTLVRPGFFYFDVGANIGLTSLPALQSCDGCTVVSIEPSPGTVHFLKRTAASSPFRNQWRIIDKCACACAGSTQFCCAPLE